MTGSSRGRCTRLALASVLSLAACATQPDRFYTLNTLPDAARAAANPTVHVHLGVTIPSMVDRTEMVIDTTQNGILILDHERWAAPLADQVSQTLARDLEVRRGDVFIGDRGFDRAGSPSVTLKVDIVRMSVQRGARASIEARWRVVGDGVDVLGTGAFDAAVDGAQYASVAQAYSRTLAALAERIAADIPR